MRSISADRENHRVQVFDGNGKYETQWKNLHRPCGFYIPYGHQPICYIGEVGPAAAVSRDIPNLGPRVSIVDHEGKLIGRFGDTPAGTEIGKFLAPHGLAVDSRGDVYVGEVSWTAWPQIYPGKPHPANLRSLQKFEKVEWNLFRFHPTHRSRSHIDQSPAPGTGSDHIVLQLAGMCSDVLASRGNVALPVQHDRSPSILKSNCIGAAGKSHLIRRRVKHGVERQLRHKDRPQNRYLRKVQGSVGSLSDLVRGGNGAFAGATCRELDDERSGSLSERLHIFGKLACEDFLHKLVQDQPTHSPRTYRDLRLRWF
jgi:hypothetical protein